MANLGFVGLELGESEEGGAAAIGKLGFAEGSEVAGDWKDLGLDIDLESELTRSAAID